VLVIVLLLFGANRLPGLARGLGSAVHEFRKGVSGAEDGTDRDEPDGRPT
jgi:sec-independent protein translocase protein TatA